MTEIFFDPEPTRIQINQAFDQFKQKNKHIEHITKNIIQKAETMQQIYANKLDETKTKLLKTSKTKEQKLKNDLLFKIIDQRTQNIIQRFHQDTQCKIKILTNENETPQKSQNHYYILHQTENNPKN